MLGFGEDLKKAEREREGRHDFKFFLPIANASMHTTLYQEASGRRWRF